MISDTGLDAEAQELLRGRVRELVLVDPLAGTWLEPVQINRALGGPGGDVKESLARAAGPTRAD